MASRNGILNTPHLPLVRQTESPAPFFTTGWIRFCYVGLVVTVKQGNILMFVPQSHSFYVFRGIKMNF